MQDGAEAEAGGNSNNTSGEPASITHDPVTANDAELEFLARVIKGEMPDHGPFEGKVAVAAVVLNRMRSRFFPNTIRGVITQPWQFSSYNSDVRGRLFWGRIPPECFRAARAALEKLWSGVEELEGER